MAASDNKESFLQRWSRLKRTGNAERDDTQAASPVPVPPAGAPATTPLPDLGAVDKLDFSSDFTAFLQPKVEESVKRAALKKLFHSPHFNQMDGLDVYIDDYGLSDPIPEDMLRQLAHAQDMLFGGEEQAQQPGAGARAPDALPEQTADGVAGSDPRPAAADATPPLAGSSVAANDL